MIYPRSQNWRQLESQGLSPFLSSKTMQLPPRKERGGEQGRKRRKWGGGAGQCQEEQVGGGEILHSWSSQMIPRARGEWLRGAFVWA